MSDACHRWFDLVFEPIPPSVPASQKHGIEDFSSSSQVSSGFKRTKITHSNFSLQYKPMQSFCSDADLDELDTSLDETWMDDLVALAGGVEESSTSDQNAAEEAGILLGPDPLFVRQLVGGSKRTKVLRDVIGSALEELTGDVEDDPMFQGFLAEINRNVTTTTTSIGGPTTTIFQAAPVLKPQLSLVTPTRILPLDVPTRPICINDMMQPKIVQTNRCRADDSTDDSSRDIMEVMRGSSDPMLLTLTSFPFRIIYTNQAFTTATGKKCVLGDSVYDIIAREDDDDDSASERKPKTLANCVTPCDMFSSGIVRIPSEAKSEGFMFCEIQVSPVVKKGALGYYSVTIKELNVGPSLENSSSVICHPIPSC